MEVTDGNLSWAATLDISGISKAKDSLVKYFRDMGLSAEEAGKRADEAMENIQGIIKEATKEMKSNAEAVDMLREAYEEIQEQLEDMEDGTAKEVLQGIGEGLQEIVSEMETMSQESNPIEDLGEGAVSARQQLREMTEELIAMKMRGEENTEAYQQLLEKVGMLKDTMADTQQAIKGMASDTATLDSVLGAAQLTAGGFSAIIGAMNLVGAGEDTKELAEAQKKLQAAIAVTTGLQSVQNALQKQSALMLGIQKLQTLAAAKAEDIKTAATGRGAIATKAATVAQKAFNAVAKANPYVLLAMAILTVVGALAAFTSGAKENERQQKSLNDELERQLNILNKLNGVYNTQQSNEINNLRNILDLLKAQGASIEVIRDAEDQLDKAEKARIDREKEDYKDLLDNAQMYEDKLEELRKKVKETNEEGNDAKERMNQPGGLFSTDYSTWEIPHNNPNYIADHTDAIVDATLEDLQTVEQIVSKIHQIQQDEENFNNKQQIKEAQRLAEDKELKDQAAREAAERRRKNLEDEKRYQDELRQAREHAEDLELDSRTDNINTRVAKAELDYERQISEAQRKADEARAQNRLELAEQYERQVSALMKKRDAEINKLYADEAEAQEQALAEMLDNYKGYDARKKAIEAKFQEDIKKLTEKRNEYDKDSEEWQKYDQAILEAEEQRKQSIIELQDEYSQLNELVKESEQLEKRIAIVREGGNDIEGKTIDELLAAKAEVDKKIKEMQSKSFKELWDEQKNELVANSIDQVTDSLYRLAEATGSLNAKEAADFMSSLSKGLKGFQQGGFVGVLIAGIEDTLSQITEDIIKAQSLEAMLRSATVDKWQADMDSMMDKGGIFGDDAIANVNGMVDVLEEARKKMEEFGAETQVFGDDFNRILGATNLLNWKNWAMGFTETNEAVNAFNEALEKGYSNLEAHVLRTNDRSWLSNFFGVNDKYENIRDIVEKLGYDLYDQYGNLNAKALQEILDKYADLSEEDRKWIEEAIAYSEKYEEAMQGVADYLNNLFGSVSDTIADQFIESFLESGKAAMDFGSVVSDVAKNMVKDLVKSMILEEVMNKYKDSFTKIITGGEYGDANARSAAMLALFTQMGGEIEALQPYIQSLLEAYQTYIGDLEGETEEMSGNLLQSASQDSVDLLNGQLNAVRTNQALMVSRVDSVILQLSGIYDEVRDFHDDSNTKLNQLIDNTSERGSIARAFGLA